MDKYCDIVPRANGWTFILNGIESDCAYHTYELAMAAAKSELAKESHTRIFRQLGLNGDMLAVKAVVFPQAPYLS